MPVIGLFFLCSLPLPSAAQVELTGFFRNYHAVQTVPDHRILIGRNRVRLDLDRELSSGKLLLSNDIRHLYSESADSLHYQLREAYMDLYFSTSDLRIGKQILVWGRADGTFITDILSPVDLREFLTQDFSDLRTGVTALSYTRYSGSNFFQFVLNPVFAPNNIPSPDSRWFPGSFVSVSIPSVYLSPSEEPALKNMQWAGRWGFRSNLNIDLDLGLLYWRYPSPQYIKELNIRQNQTATLELTETYAQSFIAMYSGTVRLTEKLLLTSEAAFYGRRDFDYLSETLGGIDLENPSPAEQQQLVQIFSQNNDGFLMERPWLIAMISLRYDLLDWTVSGQFINEHIFDYDSTILQERNYNYLTLLLSRSFAREEFAFRGFVRYNIQGRDFWINPELTYAGIDAFEASVGGQLFGGAAPGTNFGHLSFSSYANNSFGYIKVTAFF